MGLDESVAVTRLREGGAIVLGKANMHEIALGITGEGQLAVLVDNECDVHPL